MVGTIAGVLCMSYVEKIDLWFVCTCLASYMGKKSINIISKIVLMSLKLPAALEEKEDKKENSDK